MLRVFRSLNLKVISPGTPTRGWEDRSDAQNFESAGMVERAHASCNRRCQYLIDLTR